MTSNETGSPGVEDILSSAVDRQIAQQRSLQEALSGIRDAIEGLRSELDARPTGEVDDAVLERLEALDERRRAMAERIEEERRELAVRIDGLPDALFRGVRDALTPQLAGAEALERLRAELEARGDSSAVTEIGDELRSTLDGLGERIEASGKDVEALAQAVLDLNGALRDWSDGIESRVGSLAETLVGGLSDLASTQKEALESLATVVGRTSDGVRDSVAESMSEAVQPLDRGLATMRERITDVEEVSRYIQDQAADLDKLLRGLRELPDRLEAVVAQALRRALTARASFERDARRALDDAVAPISEPLDRLGEPLEIVAEALEGGRLSEELRRAGLRNVELATRMEEFQDAILERVEESEVRRREREDELADAIEGLGRRLDEWAEEIRKPDEAGGRSSSSTEKKSSKSTKKSPSGRSGSSKGSSSKSSGSKKNSGSKKSSGSKKGGSGASSETSGSSKKKSGSSGSSSKKKRSSSSKKSSGSAGTGSTKSSSSGKGSRASSSRSRRTNEAGESSQGYIPV